MRPYASNGSHKYTCALGVTMVELEDWKKQRMGIALSEEERKGGQTLYLLAASRAISPLDDPMSAMIIGKKTLGDTDEEANVDSLPIHNSSAISLKLSIWCIISGLCSIVE